jgi:hypothetical protein
MQAKTSVSDYRESGGLSWVGRQQIADVGRAKPKLVVLSSKQTKLKPGLY